MRMRMVQFVLLGLVFGLWAWSGLSHWLLVLSPRSSETGIVSYKWPVQ